MKFVFSLLFSSCLIFLIVKPGHSFELEGHGGFYRYDASLAGRFDSNDSPMAGLRFGSGARHIISGETTIGYGPADDMKIVLLMGNLLLNVSMGDVVPFVTIGTGTTILVPEGADEDNGRNLDTERKFTLNYGGGLRYFLRDSIALRFDIRNYVIFDLTFDPRHAESGGESISVGTINNLMIGGGLSVLF